MIRSFQPRGVVLKPRASVHNQIDSPDGTVGLTVKQAGKASSNYSFKAFSGSETQPRIAFEGTRVTFGSGAATPDTYIGRQGSGGFKLEVPGSSTPVDIINGLETNARIQLISNQLKFGSGSAATDTVIERWGAKAFRTLDTQIRIESPPGDQAGGVGGNGNVPLWIECRTSDGAILDGNDATGTIRALMVRGRPIEGTNGSRTDTPLTDAANVADHTSFSFYEARSLESSPEQRYNSKGSLHHFYSDVTLIPHSGGGALTTPFGVAATNLLTRTAHGLAAGDPIQFTALTGGTGLAVQTPYFVIASGLTANDFKISATLGGAEINFTTDITAGTFERIPYCEIVNFYGAITAQRKAAFVSNMELRTIVAANSPARVAVARFIVEEANAISSYNATNFGAGSRFIDSGAMGLEVLSQGAARAGTGISIMGSTGWERALRVYNSAQVLVSGIDGEGGVFSRVKAGSFVDGDFRLPTNGLLGINSSANDLEYRSGGVWRGLLDQSYIKQPVHAASTANLTLTAPGATIDGVTPTTGVSRILVKDQTTESQNGIYIWNGAASTMTRARDADEGIEMRGGVQVAVEDGTKNKDTAWMLVINGIPTIGSSTLRFSRTQPAYARGADLDLWATGSAISETFQRESATTAVALVDNRMFFAGGCVIPANRTVTNISTYCVVVGTSYVAHWWALIRQSDWVCLQRTANSTSLMTINAVNTRALQATYTAPVDTPCYVVIGWDGTTVPQFAGTAAGQANLLSAAPILGAESSVAPTTTPPAVGAALAAPAVTRTQNIYAYLT